MQADNAWELLQPRWDALFGQLAEGLDVPPTQRLRLEGMMETLVLLECVDRESVDLAMNASYQRINGRDLASEFGDDWREFFPFPQVPGFQQRAPVVPSTPD